MHILFVDDEPNVLKSLQRSFRKERDWTCHYAGSPSEAIDILARHKIAVLVSDHQMPQMTGAEFLSRVKEKRPDTVRIMLTGQAGLEAVQDAVNQGEIYRFLLKPWRDEDLKQAILNALELHELQAENRRLLETTQSQNQQLTELNSALDHRIRQRTEQLSDALHTAHHLNKQLEESLLAGAKVFFAMLEMARPALGSHSRRVAEYAKEIGALLGAGGKDLAELEIAALLHDVGKLGLPPFVLEKSLDDLKPQEVELYRTHPTSGAENMKSLAGYESICEMVESHHERMDGTGFPRRLGGDHISQSAYVVGISDELDRLVDKPGEDHDFKLQYAIQRLADTQGRGFPATVVQAALEYIDSLRGAGLGEDVIRVGLKDLVPNMTLAGNIYSMSGTMLLAKGAVLTAQRMRRIRSIAQIDPIAGDILVHRKRQASNPSAASTPPKQRVHAFS